ncbi:MAG: hypothetical protein QM346_17565 [Chloroflexota bacterium]|nr:hypothetical protein [Chloroflexota bacterium]
MPASEERAMILRMVEEGKISAEEGSRLLAALGDEAQTVPPRSHTAAGTSFDTSTALRIRVSDAVTGKSKVNVNIPVGLVRLGLRFIPQSANIDAEKIMHALDTGLKGRIVDVVAEDEGTHVEIYVE